MNSRRLVQRFGFTAKSLVCILDDVLAIASFEAASEPLVMWPIPPRVNSPKNEDEDLLAEIVLAEAG
jgi:hypothetical protein